MPRAICDDASIFYEYDEDASDESRSGSIDVEEPIVFVQDLGYGRWMWRWQREAVSGDVIAPDTRGTGRSGAGLPPIVPRLPRRLRTPLLSGVASYSVAGLAADLEAVLEDAGVRRAHLVGAGLGGMIVQQHAIEYSRAKTLTLCGTSHGGTDAVAMSEETRSTLLERPSGANEREGLRHRMRPAFSERFTNRNPHLMDRIVEWRREQDAGAPALEAQIAAIDTFDGRDRLDRIRAPTLVIHGTDDRIVPSGNARLLEEAIPNARLELVEGGSHCCFIESADRVNELLGTFLEDSSEPGGETPDFRAGRVGGE
ncbi:alpha/beta fold hydrolase [Natrarchaeobius halalkaliphilus]|uniref:Alpha/beta fold hydrolase n=1 Tax=Natrarchaeobius halalkaliphilus TaxID=1679091 RepID=A0A3N6MG84_9EURY|nr:alpha/beta hydrolase [Natrarchaeobius halalkaliphilus]RQG92946.1 alpha/beta fold hydrolase [Natrarchaeobius halalkaliphilus]